MEETKEKKASVEEFSRAIQELLRENLVGFVCEQGVESFFFLSCRQKEVLCFGKRGMKKALFGVLFYVNCLTA